MGVIIKHKIEEEKVLKIKIDKNVETVLITREIRRDIADACKKLYLNSRPKIPLNYMCEEGLRMFLKEKGIEI